MQDTETKISIPFFIGASDHYSSHSANLPTSYDFCLKFDQRSTSLRQVGNAKLQGYLKESYRLGLQLGVPSDDTALGNPYVDDFMRFVVEKVPEKGSILEIGCGTGYLSYRLQSLGYNITAVEPGYGYEAFWKKYNVDVINEFFPTDRVTGEFDAIIMYTVLEHIENPAEYIKNLGNYLRKGGRILSAVPDCEYEINKVDPSILIHEHFNFYTKKSLSNEFIFSDYEVDVRHSRFGRSLYSCASLKIDGSFTKIDSSENTIMGAYVNQIDGQLSASRKRLNTLASNYKLAVYCPTRLLNILNSNNDIDFYDDSEYLHGRYLYPFRNQVKSRRELLKGKVPDLLIIGSMTFGEKIQSELKQGGFTGRMILLENLFKEID